MDYTSKHELALRRIKKAGVAVSFEKRDSGLYDPLTDTYLSGEATTTVSGYAVEVPGEGRTVEGDTIVERITLLFVPTAFGNYPDVESTLYWADKLRTVRHVKPIRPGEDTIAAEVELV